MSRISLMIGGASRISSFPPVSLLRRVLTALACVQPMPLRLIKLFGFRGFGLRTNSRDSQHRRKASPCSGVRKLGMYSTPVGGTDGVGGLCAGGWMYRDRKREGTCERKSARSQVKVVYPSPQGNAVLV